MTGRFPEQFLWGAATAAHQVEGGNTNSDAWAMEHMPDSLYAEPSGDALDFYHRYRDDIALVAGLGLNAFRFGVEWARIEPEPGLVSAAALDHYSRVVDACLERGIAPVITLHHFTSPRWLLPLGGWGTHVTAARFAEFCNVVVRRLGDRVHWYCTINEANTPLQVTGNGLLSPALAGKLEAGRARAAAAFGIPVADFVPFFPYASSDQAIAVVADAHRQAVDAVHAAYSAALAGVTLSMQEQYAEPGGEAAAHEVDETLNGRFLREMGSVGDFVGVQNYARLRYGSQGRILDTENLSGNGFALEPRSLAATCRMAWEVTGKPVLITEHGCDLDTSQDHRGPPSSPTPCGSSATRSRTASTSAATSIGAWPTTSNGSRAKGQLRAARRRPRHPAPLHPTECNGARWDRRSQRRSLTACVSVRTRTAPPRLPGRSAATTNKEESVPAFDSDGLYRGRLKPRVGRDVVDHLPHSLNPDPLMG